MRCGLATVVSAALVILVLLSSTIVVVNYIGPLIEEGKVHQAFNTAKQTMITIDSVMRELIAEAPGAKRTLKLKSDIGQFLILPSEDSIKYRVKTDVPIIEPGTTYREGNMLISSGAYVKAYVSDVNNDGADDVILENDNILFAVKKLGNSTSPVFINTTNFISMMKNKRLNITLTPITKIMIDEFDNSSYGYGYTELTDSGYYLASSGIKLFLNSSSYAYEALFKLSGNNDFIELEIRVL